MDTNEIHNMKISEGTLNYIGEEGRLSGQVSIRLPNGALIEVRYLTHDNCPSLDKAEVSIHNMGDTGIAIFRDKVSKKQEKIPSDYGDFIITNIKKKEVKENCPRCYGKDPEYVHPDDGDPYSDIYEVCPDCGEEWGEA